MAMHYVRSQAEGHGARGAPCAAALSNYCLICKSTFANGEAAQHHVLNALKKGRCFVDGSARCHQKVQHSIRQCTMRSHLAGNAEALDAHLISDHLEQISHPDHYLTIDVGAASRRT
eukprot:9178198-Pyramimonas_sp.AAC.1